MTEAGGRSEFIPRLIALATVLTVLVLGMDTLAKAALGPVVTAQVKDSNPGPGDGDPLQGGNGADLAGGVNLDGILIYDANDGFGGFGHGQELWRSDGTEAGTYMIKDINLGSMTSSTPSEMTVMNGDVYFSALGEFQEGTELWKTDGTAQGTELVEDLNPTGFKSGGPHELTNVNGTLYFLANSDDANGSELWKSDGTTGGTEIVKDIQANLGSASNLTAVGDRLYFAFDDGVDGKELWTSDGSLLGTEQVKDINPGAASGLPGLVPQPASDFFNFEGKLYFRADDGSNGRELWSSDGTGGGTTMVKDIDGTPANSMEFQASFEQFGDELFFAYDFGIYKTDGTGPGTVLVANSGNTPTNLIAVEDTLYFIQNYTRFFKSDGTMAGTQEVFDAEDVLSGLTAFDGNVYTSFDDGNKGGTSGVELWRSDGTVPGTERLTDINPGTGGSLINERTVAGERLFFRGDDNGANGVELWSTRADRTAPQTTIISGPAEGETIETGSATFTFTSNEADSEFTCSFDGGPPESCDSGSRTYSGLAEGAHAFSVTAADPAPFTGVDQTPATRNFTFTAPVVDPPVVDPPAVDPPAVVPPDPEDTTSPALRLRIQKKQKNPRRILVRATCPEEACTLRATGNIKVKKLRAGRKAGKAKKFKLKRSTFSVPAGKTVKLRLKLSKKASKRVRRVLRKKVSKARLRVVATDAAGNSTIRKRTVKVRRGGKARK